MFLHKAILGMSCSYIKSGISIIKVDCIAWGILAKGFRSNLAIFLPQKPWRTTETKRPFWKDAILFGSILLLYDFFSSTSFKQLALTLRNESYINNWHDYMMQLFKNALIFDLCTIVDFQKKKSVKVNTITGCSNSIWYTLNTY